MIVSNCSTVSDSDGEKREGYTGNKKRFEIEFQTFFVVLPGLEPGISGPESDVLPLHHRTVFVVSSSMFLDYGCKDTDIFYSCKYFEKKFHQNKHFSFSPVLNLQGLYIY